MSFVRYLGYGLFFVASFAVSLYLTFPWNVVKERVLEIATKESKMEIEADSLEPHWFTGAILKGVKIKTNPKSEPIAIDELRARAHVLSFLGGGWGGSVALPIAQGNVEADVDASDDVFELVTKIDGLELSLVPGMADAIGLPLGGKFSLDADLEIGMKEATKTSGNLALRGVGFEIMKGGKVAGFPVPELAIGDFDWKVPIDKGKAKLDKQTIRGENVELILDGELGILYPIERSTVNLTLSFKPTDAFLKKEPLLNALLMNIQNAKGSDGFYSYALTGSVKHPRFSARRR